MKLVDLIKTNHQLRVENLQLAGRIATVENKLRCATRELSVKQGTIAELTAMLDEARVEAASELPTSVKARMAHLEQQNETLRHILGMPQEQIDRLAAVAQGAKGEAA